MVHFQFVQSVKLLFGPGSIGQLGEIMKLDNAKKTFIATDEGIVKAGIAKKVTDALDSAGAKYVVFDKILPDAPDYLAEEAYEEFKKQGCDFLIAIGGGSTIDSAKAINLLRANPGPLKPYAEMNFSDKIKKANGFICIPTTAGTGSELSNGIILSDSTHAKYSLLNPLYLPDYAVLDPTLLTGTPKHITASTGYDALSHVCEGVLSKFGNTMGDVLAIGVARNIVKWLPVAYRDGGNIEARSNMLANSCWGGWSLMNVLANTGHSYAHVLGSMFRVPHGYGCAYALPWVTEFNAIEWPDKVKLIGESVFDLKLDKATPAEIGAEVRKVMMHLRDEVLEIKPAKEYAQPDDATLQEASARILKEPFQMFNPRDMNLKQAREIFDKIFA
ncbi:MAG: iron-containing alcohol dehydrogenase [Deltaproteobacteria bacterium]|jgi:alcohol dehydrogenase|nr:iron-containing alcohol dehydrogenase [Deltaproteobacteria bacterium]